MSSSKSRKSKNVESDDDSFDLTSEPKTITSVKSKGGKNKNSETESFDLTSEPKTITSEKRKSETESFILTSEPKTITSVSESSSNLVAGERDDTKISMNIKKNADAILETVLTNIVKMLTYRKWIEDLGGETVSKIVSSLLKSKKEDNVYSIKLSKNLLDLDTYKPSANKKEWKNFNGNTVYVLLFNFKVKKKEPVIADFMSKYASYHKLIVVDDITVKAAQNLTLQDKYTEVFKERELMINIMDHNCAPQSMTVLNETELSEILESYKLQSRDKLMKQYDADPLSRYLFVERGQCIRIVRNSPTTGTAIAYRIIVKGVWN